LVAGTSRVKIEIWGTVCDAEAGVPSATDSVARRLQSLDVEGIPFWKATSEYSSSSLSQTGGDGAAAPQNLWIHMPNGQQTSLYDSNNDNADAAHTNTNIGARVNAAGIRTISVGNEDDMQVQPQEEDQAMQQEDEDEEEDMIVDAMPVPSFHPPSTVTQISVPSKGSIYDFGFFSVQRAAGTLAFWKSVASRESNKECAKAHDETKQISCFQVQCIIHTYSCEKPKCAIRWQTIYCA
jgi:hypothetical protein